MWRVTLPNLLEMLNSKIRKRVGDQIHIFCRNSKLDARSHDRINCQRQARLRTRVKSPKQIFFLWRSAFRPCHEIPGSLCSKTFGKVNFHYIIGLNLLFYDRLLAHISISPKHFKASQTFFVSKKQILSRFS